MLVKIALGWLPLAVVATALTWLVYMGLYQNYRHTVNDSQVQLAEDAANIILAGGDPSILSLRRIDIDKSLSPFITVYDADKKAVASSGFLDDQPPIPPESAFISAKEHTDNRISWTPKPDVPLSIVMKYFNNAAKEGYVLAGMNLRETNQHQKQLQELCLIVYGALMLGTLALVSLGEWMKARTA